MINEILTTNYKNIKNVLDKKQYEHRNYYTLKGMLKSTELFYKDLLNEIEKVKVKKQNILTYFENIKLNRMKNKTEKLIKELILLINYKVVD